MTHYAVLWRGLYLPGHEACRLSRPNALWQLTGVAVFAHQQQPCWLAYHIGCDANWKTQAGQVNGWLGDKRIELELSVQPDQHWQLNGVAQPQVTGCIDLDLNFSPSTNLLPIRRLGLAIGQEADVKAAWLRFPSFELQPLAQLYRRLDETTYRYESAGGEFVTELQVHPAGFVLSYPAMWQAEIVS